MGFYSFQKLDSSKAEAILPELFRILHTNMSRIAPTSNSYAEDEAIWLSYMLSTFQESCPNIVLMYAGGNLAGYFQYSISDHTLMVEEVEIKPEYQRTMLFYRLCSYLCNSLPHHVQYIEAYVNKHNAHSLRINKKLGLEVIGATRNGNSWHLRGDARNIKAYFSK